MDFFGKAYHKYKNISVPRTREKLQAEKEPGNTMSE